MIWFSVFCCSLVLAQVDDGANRATSPDADGVPGVVLSEAARSSLLQLVDQLGSPDYDERHQATQLLKRMDKSLTEELKRIMPRIRDHEVRLRIREIAEHLFYRDVMHALGGFLGIQLSGVDGDSDSRLTEIAQPLHFELRGAVRIDGVVADTAAQRGGLRAGDLIIGIDGQAVTATRGNANPFIQIIKGKPPGTRVDLVLFREPEVLERSVVLGYRKLDSALLAQNPKHLSAIKQAQAAFDRWCREAATAP